MCHTICLKHAILPLIALTLHVTACGPSQDENPNNNIDEVPCGGLCPFEVCVFDVCLDDEDAPTHQPEQFNAHCPAPNRLLASVNNDDADADADGVDNAFDNCPVVYNPDQNEGDCLPLCPTLRFEGDAFITSAEALNDLHGVTIIEGDLNIFGTQLETLRGLECLTEVRGSVRINNNTALSDISALRRLAFVQGDLKLGTDKSLVTLQIQPAVSLEPLRALRVVGGSLWLESLQEPATADGLEALACVGGDLIIGDTALETITPTHFGALEQIGDSIQFLGNNRLETINSFNRLRVVNGNVAFGGFIPQRDSNYYCQTYDADPSNSYFCDTFDPIFEEQLSHTVAGNRRLRTVEGFAALEEIGGDFKMIESSSMERLSLPVLTTLGGTLRWGELTAVQECSPLDGAGCSYWFINIRVSRMTVFDGFPNLQSAGGVLFRGHPNLRRIELPSLERIQGPLTLGGRVRQLDGNLTEERSIYIPLHNGALESVSMDSLHQVDGDMLLAGPGSWATAFDALKYVQGTLTLEDYPTNTIEGLNALEEIGGDLRIILQEQATELTGLNALRSVQGSFYLGDAPEELYSFCDALEERGNQRLASVSGLSSLESVGRDMLIVDNPMMAQQSIERLIEGIGNIQGQTHVCNPWTASCPHEPGGYGFLCTYE